MEKEIYQLRTTPKFEIILNEKIFHIINEDDKNDSGTYSYSLTDSVELKTKKINWIVTVLDVIFETLITNTSFGSIYREKNRLIFNYNNQKKIILLTDCDMDKAEITIQKLKAKLK
ncbi:MAG: hypothetical protein R2797_09575 [Gelidibacter sp.]